MIMNYFESSVDDTIDICKGLKHDDSDPPESERYFLGTAVVISWGGVAVGRF